MFLVETVYTVYIRVNTIIGSIWGHIFMVFKFVFSYKNAMHAAVCHYTCSVCHMISIQNKHCFMDFYFLYFYYRKILEHSIQ